MELKTYQKEVITDLKKYLDLINTQGKYDKAFEEFWKEKGIILVQNGIQKYNNEIKNTPHICFKVPTGGGKTYIAANSIKPIFDSMPSIKEKAVVWLVPSDAILEQTIKSLKTPSHPYHQAIARDFGGKFEIYTKTELLNAQNFNPTTVREQLSIFILSYDSLRSKTKENRKIYQENGNLAQFEKYYKTPETLIENTDTTALIQVINQLSPLVIVDESHHAVSDLSIEMLQNLNPSFIIDLTATPKKNSNILSYVEAIKLKNENMVKLPVIVYNRKTKEDVIANVIDLRNKLEQYAKQEQKQTGTYIRPIVLFQAEPKNKEDSETFEKVKANLIESGIPKEQIAIKTADINEIKNIDLLSQKCEIRYIITVNALKEGWDCPFAYILATLANRSSKIDVEQIVGRILRQPYTKQHKTSLLNLSYVFTSSSDFQKTIEEIIKGLNKAGFSKHDYREVEINEIPQGQSNIGNFTENPTEKISETGEDTFGFDTRTVKEKLKQSSQNENSKEPENNPLAQIIHEAETQNNSYEKKIEDQIVTSSGELLPAEITDKMPKNYINEKYREELENFRIPQFFIKTEPSLFVSDDKILLTKEQLGKGFTLRNESTKINFDDINDEIAKLDIEDENSSQPKYLKVNESEIQYFKQQFSQIPAESRIRNAEKILVENLNKMDIIDSQDLRIFIRHVLESMNQDQLSELLTSTNVYAAKIKKYINSLLDNYRKEQFRMLSDKGQLICEDYFSLKPELPIQNWVSTISKSLYQIEGEMNKYERDVILEVASLDNIEWWHRNIEKQEFYINGFINHYPDFIVKTKKGKIILIETKGDYLENDDSENKAKLGCAWQNKAGNNYSYFMIYQTKDVGASCVYPFSELKNLIRDL